MPDNLKCESCGCTDARACPGGCHWVSLEPPVCSACVDHGELPNAAPIDAESAGDDFCPANSIGMHQLLWLTERTGYCTNCKTSFVAQDAA